MTAPNEPCDQLIAFVTHLSSVWEILLWVHDDAAARYLPHQQRNVDCHTALNVVLETCHILTVESSTAHKTMLSEQTLLSASPGQQPKTNKQTVFKPILRSFYIFTLTSQLTETANPARQFPTPCLKPPQFSHPIHKRNECGNSTATYQKASHVRLNTPQMDKEKHPPTYLPAHLPIILPPYQTSTPLCERTSPTDTKAIAEGPEKENIRSDPIRGGYRSSEQS